MQLSAATFALFPKAFLLRTTDSDAALLVPTRDVKSTSGFGALSRRTEVRLARRRGGSAASRRVASPRVAPLRNDRECERVTMAVSAACALSFHCAGPLFFSRFSAPPPVPPRLFHPFGITRLSFNLAFESHPRSPITRAYFFLSHVCASARSPACLFDSFLASFIHWRYQLSNWPSRCVIV